MTQISRIWRRGLGGEIGSQGDVATQPGPPGKPSGFYEQPTQEVTVSFPGRGGRGKPHWREQGQLKPHRWTRHIPLTDLPPSTLLGTLSSGQGTPGPALGSGRQWHSSGVRKTQPGAERGCCGAGCSLTPVGCFLASSRGALKLADRLGVARTFWRGTLASPRNL